MTRAEAAMVKRGELTRLEAIADRVLAGKRRVAAKRAPRKWAEKAETLKAISAEVALRREVIARDGGVCQGCRAKAGTEMDHFWGRGREASVESCWMLCRECHHQKTFNVPSRLAWIQGFRVHARGHKYKAQLVKCDRAIALETGQHPEAQR
jgi:5-methylcytosine-specific restriction endonuclease McrA